jgi:hypothetical protein
MQVKEFILGFSDAQRLGKNAGDFPIELFGGIPVSRIPMEAIADLVERFSKLEDITVHALVIRFTPDGGTVRDAIIGDPFSDIAVSRPHEWDHPILL